MPRFLRTSVASSSTITNGTSSKPKTPLRALRSFIIPPHSSRSAKLPSPQQQGKGEFSLPGSGCEASGQHEDGKPVNRREECPQPIRRKFLPTLQKPENAQSQANCAATRFDSAIPPENSAHHSGVEEEITATNEQQPPIHLPAWPPSPLASSILADSAKANSLIGRQLTASKTSFFPQPQDGICALFGVSLFCPLLQFTLKSSFACPSHPRIHDVAWTATASKDFFASQRQGGRL